MDFWDFLFDNDYKRRADIESLKQTSRARRRSQSRCRQSVNENSQRITQLEDHVGELALLCRSLLTILREDGTVEPQRFEEVMHQIDADDGEVDGKITQQDPSV